MSLTSFNSSSFRALASMRRSGSSTAVLERSLEAMEAPETPSKSFRRASVKQVLRRNDQLLLFTAVMLLVSAGSWFTGYQYARSRSSRRTIEEEGYFPGSSVFSRPKDEGSTRASGRTLVMYVFSGSDTEYASNLQFFVREAVQENDNCDYYIVIQQDDGLTQPDPLPPLPSNAQYVYHKNECFDFGTIGWLVEAKRINTRKYKYFVWLNSSVRGPFLPAYLVGKMHWTTPLLQKLRGKVKLVGPTVNCGLTGAQKEHVPHVQSYTMATDHEGFGLIRDARVFGCYKNYEDVVYHSEIGASAAIFGAGYTIDSLQIRYQGVNWTDSKASRCNGSLNPTNDLFYDGTNIDPLEVLFVKVKGVMTEVGWAHVQRALKLDKWLQNQRLPPDQILSKIAGNDFWGAAAKRIEEAKRKGAKCFDMEFYLRASPYDMAWVKQQPKPAEAAFKHFLNHGLIEGRPHRFKC